MFQYKDITHRTDMEGQLYVETTESKVLHKEYSNSILHVMVK